MPSPYLMPSTSKRGDCFAGASATDCTARWNLAPSLGLLGDTNFYAGPGIQLEQGPFVMHWSQQVPQGRLMYTLTFQQTAAEPEIPLPLEAWQRILCHALLNRIPDEGLDEVLENLREAWQFYTFKPSGTRRLEAIQEGPARLGETCVRPVFQAAEE